MHDYLDAGIYQGVLIPKHYFISRVIRRVSRAKYLIPEAHLFLSDIPAEQQAFEEGIEAARR